MGKGRLEAFSDGVIAIIITIMVLELRIPHGTGIADLIPVMPVLLSYMLSFLLVGIYWNNHHHMLHAAHHVNGRILWANMHLLFWLSLVPFTTGWIGENDFAATPVAVYGAVQLMAAVAYLILALALVAVEGRESKLAIALGKDRKGKISVALYVIAIPLAFLSPWIALALYVTVAVIWLIPDRRIEKIVGT